jgi:hypothetical protein
MRSLTCLARLEIEVVNSRCVKTAGVAIVLGKHISGRALEKRFEAPECARINTDVRGSLAQHPDLRAPQLPVVARVPSNAAAINDPDAPLRPAEVDPAERARG